jgi:phospholipid/cholesterol/gamma-HCH transport system substrate-binding protein
MNDQAVRFRLGIFVLGVLILLGVLIILFGGLPNYFKPSETYYIIFDSAPGVSAGTPVRRSGVRIGEVRTFTLDDQTGTVRVEISVSPEYSLRLQDQPTLSQGLLGGDATIDFVPRPPDGKEVLVGIVEPGSTLEGVTQADAGTLVQKTTEVMPPAKESMEELRKALRRFDKMAPLMEETLKEYRDIGKATRQVIPDLRRTNEELQLAARNWSKVGERFDVLLQNNETKIVQAIDRLQDALKRISDVFSDQNQKNLSIALKNVKNSSERLDPILADTEKMIKESQKTLERVNESLRKTDDVLTNMQKATKPMADRSEKIFKNMEETTDQLNKALGEARELMRLIGRGDGTLQKLLTDPCLYNNLNDTAYMVNKLMPRLDRILRDVEIFADKIARHPEALGVGGVVRPGNGLKSPPTALPWKGPGH